MPFSVHILTFRQPTPGPCRAVTAFITDLGMCGPVDSILGVRKDIIIDRFRTNMPKRFEIASGEIKGNGAVFTVFKINLQKLNRSISDKRDLCLSFYSCPVFLMSW